MANITPLYRKATTRDVTAANEEARKLATELYVDDHCQVHSENTAFVQMKDHKENFHQADSGKKPCRLINPAKPELGKISKQFIEKINQYIRTKTGLGQ